MIRERGKIPFRQGNVVIRLYLLYIFVACGHDAGNLRLTKNWAKLSGEGIESKGQQ
jgi:hypothetical protein